MASRYLSLMDFAIQQLRPPVRQGLHSLKRLRLPHTQNRRQLSIERPTHAALRLPRQRPATTPGCDSQLRQSSDQPNITRKPSVSQVDEELHTAHHGVRTIVGSNSIPSERNVLRSIKDLATAARHLMDLNNLDRPAPPPLDNATSALLSLEGRRRKPAQQVPESAPLKKTIDELSDSAYRLLKFDNTFITQNVLRSYVDLQALLRRPATFPEIFTLYATKPAPQASKSRDTSVQYSPTSPTAVASAIDTNVANTALDVATTKRDLPLAFDIIDAAYCAPAFKRNKIFRQALFPIAATALMPLAAFSIASSLSVVQNGMDPAEFTKVAFAGLFTYAGVVGSLGYVSMTTVNDQMQRVTWAIGMPLHERWLREEERAAADRIALAWGFPEKNRWGEEEGDDWEIIREWCGVRGMVLDKVGLMEGME